MTFDEWFVRYPLPAEIDTMDDTDREQWTWALRSAYKTGMLAEREVCAKVWAEQDEFTLRGELATLKCWPRLSGDEAADLVNFFAAHAQPKREWVGLTDEEIEQMWKDSSPYYDKNDFARAIEAKLKEKNT